MSTLRPQFSSESLSAILLLCCAALAFYFANSDFQALYHQIIHYQIGPMTLHHWINDGLMVLFFFVVGLEIKRELLIGELSSKSKATLPVIAALGGALTPALIYYFFNSTPETIKGWGIPMATDIAFAVGVLSLFSKKVPRALKVFLLALAIADDLFAILVIAVFYTEKILLIHLMGAAVTLGSVVLMQKLKIKNYFAYFFIGIFLWYFVFKSGIHATIAGVVLGLFTPLKIENSTQQPIRELIRKLHPWIYFFVMPVFALANAGVELHGLSIREVITHPVAYGVFFGLFLGKPIGVMCFIQIATLLKIIEPMKPDSKIKFLAVAQLTGIGFTMAIFICSLSLSEHLQSEAKVGILLASLLSAIVGALLLSFSKPVKL